MIESYYHLLKTHQRSGQLARRMIGGVSDKRSDSSHRIDMTSWVCGDDDDDDDDDDDER